MKNNWLFAVRHGEDCKAVYLCCYITFEDSRLIRFHSCGRYHEVKTSEVVFRTKSPSYTELAGSPTTRESLVKNSFEDIEAFACSLE